MIPARMVPAAGPERIQTGENRFSVAWARILE